MSNYQNGKIYKLICNDENLIYIGSTTQLLHKRLYQHKNYYKNNKSITSSKLFDKGNVKIVLIELYPCNSKMELFKRERHFIETLECVNKSIPTRNKNEWYIENKEIIKKRSKEWGEKNKEKRKQYLEKWLKNNPEKRKQQRNKSNVKCYQKKKLLKED
tara:strand:+ start:100 stop:576 length:477 start_codon:yes stop_codon:yes gene_type:complete